MVEVIKVSNGWFVRLKWTEHGRTEKEFACKEWSEVVEVLEWARTRSIL